MLSRIWTFIHRIEFAEKLSKKAQGTFKNVPRFALAHCIPWTVFLVERVCPLSTSPVECGHL